MATCLSARKSTTRQGNFRARVQASRPSIQEKDEIMQVIEKRQARRALIALLLGGVLIGASPIFVRLSELGPVSTAFWRLSLAILPLLLFSAREPSSAGKKPRSVLDFFLVCVPGMLLGFE